MSDGKLTEPEAQLIVDHCDECEQIFRDNLERFAELTASQASNYLTGQINYWQVGIKAFRYARQYAIDRTRK